MCSIYNISNINRLKITVVSAVHVFGVPLSVRVLLFVLCVSMKKKKSIYQRVQTLWRLQQAPWED